VEARGLVQLARLNSSFEKAKYKENKMKIAAVSEDGVTISQHFGRAPFYVVVTIEDGKIISREKRDKMGHAQFGGETHEEAHGQDPRGHGFDPAAQDRHARMAAAIADCEVLLARGMGAGAYQGMEQAGIRPVVTDVTNIDEAVQAYLAGSLKDHVEKLH
jgi:predicted Fe-Mo cluster-binding NifX family protein